MYDDQDRLTSYGNTADGYAYYAYTDNGDLDSRVFNGEDIEIRLRFHGQPESR